MTVRRVLGAVSALAAAAFLVGGGAAIKWYVWDVVIREAGSPDRSMLFWGLPILFIGGCALVVGGVLVWVARRLVLPLR